MSTLKRNFDFLLLAIVVSGFAFVGAQRLGTVPLPDSDESMMLQIPYEMLNRGKLAFPMKSFYGGNIENAWHSLTPLAFVTLSGFFKVFGWGLAQGRAFNLITALLTFLMIYLIARKLFTWQVGLTAILLMISDPLFLARSRLLRYDLLAAAFALLAFYLYEIAEERGHKLYYLASGLAAGAGVMCHTNVLYMLCVVAALMLLKDGWRILKKGKAYLFAAGALAAMSYEIGFAIIDYHNFMLQTRKDDVHFRVLEPMGWLNNLLTEPARYALWFDARGTRINHQSVLLHVFLYLTIVAIIYLIARSLLQIKRGRAMSEPRVRVLVTTVVVVLFFAFVTQRKVTQYVVHLSPWFALCVAVLLNDGVARIRRLRLARWRWAKQAYAAAMVSVALVAAAFAYELLSQNRSYLAQVRNPDQASFEDLKTVLRSVVPDGVCPASIASGYLWLAFPEQDQCYFAYMEATLDEPLELDAKDYALIVKPKFESRLRKLTGSGFEKYHLLGKLKKTAFGTFDIYYTGNDPRFLSRATKRYYFFGRQRGYVSDEQLARARDVWASDAAELTPKASEANSVIEPDDPDEQPERAARTKLIDLGSVELVANTVYQVSAVASNPAHCELLVLDDSTGALIQRIQRSEQESEKQLDGLFKTLSGTRIRLAIRLLGSKADEALPVSHINIREIAPL